MTPLVERCRHMMRTGASVDELLSLMRREGQSQMSSIGMLMELTGMTLRHAKTAVHNSAVWQDVRGEIETFQERLDQVAHEQQKKPGTS